ncbi:MAG: alpha/beta hydrolase [Gammaproteobacteria bacterium]|nr:alpha/beta hydrolase [Gammaproteobacteria bacterium]
MLITICCISACSNLLFVPVKPFPLTPDGAGLQYEDQFIDTADNMQLHGWKVFAEKKRVGNILFFHGNGDNVSTQLPNTFWLAKEGYDLYFYDYRGYGLSQGTSTLDDTINDTELMIGHVVEQLADDEKLIVIGHSLGGSMAIYTVAHSAYRDRIEALISIEAFSDYHDVTQDVLSKSWLLWALQWPLSFTVDNSYRPLDSIGLISPIPVAIIHSEADEMIPMYHAETLFGAAKQPKSFLLINSNHSNVLFLKDNRQVLFDYLKTLKKSPE